MSTKRIILIAALALVATGLVAVFYIYNKKDATIEQVATTEITADQLNAAFLTDEASANKSYLSKPLTVSGKVVEVSKNADNKTVLLLASSDPMSGVQCTLRDATSAPSIGSSVEVSGFCNGFTMVVVLDDCILKP
jgi:Na+-translocating ferredoxin:NAD+ oxidoreductase RnfG subunit